MFSTAQNRTKETSASRKEANAVGTIDYSTTKKKFVHGQTQEKNERKSRQGEAEIFFLKIK